MRISDWSSDVCSSDLPGAADRRYRCRSPCRSLVSGVQYPATLAQGSAILPAFSAIKKTACSTVSIPANLGGGRSEEHTSELQSLMRISYAVFCLKKKKKQQKTTEKTKHTHYKK